MKKVLLGLWMFLTLIFLGLTVNYVSNQIMIPKWKNGEMQGNPFGWLGILQPYVASYNEGNAAFWAEEYEKAITHYEKALRTPVSHKHDRECMIRTNLALAMVKSINPDEITNDTVDDVIAYLEEAITILVTEDCATDEDDGHYEDAQLLKNEIEEMIRQLEEKKEGQAEEAEDDTQPDDSTTEEAQTTQESDADEVREKQEKLEQLQNESQKSRRKGLDYKNELNNYEYYDGKSW